MTVSLGRVVFWSVIATTPLALALFRSRRWGGGPLHNTVRLFTGYPWHLVLFMVILVEKNWVDSLNDPIRAIFGDFTWVIHRIEGDAVLHIQEFFRVSWLTAFLSVHYLWAYVFLNYFTVILWAYRDDRELANMAALCYSIVYILAIPFYIFFNVQVTSDFIPRMDALLYHSGPSFYDFFVRVDPLDNAFPSLHMAIPVGLIFTTWWTMRRRGYTIWDWEHRHYLWFLLINTAIFTFSILYLGIHWILDIPGGIFVGLLGAIIADEFKWDLFGALNRLQRRTGQLLRPVVAPVGRLMGHGRQWVRFRLR
jgi:membrane-associated phospholipid phosphatase